MPPLEVDGYKLLRLLGRGGMGCVYLAHDEPLDRTVAIKFIAAGRLDLVARGRFMTEARALARIQHPNVLAVYRANEFEGHPYIVSELVRGRSLDHLELPLSGPRALELGLGLARGLAAAHRQGIVHRDIKPSNAMITDSGEVKLLDFGLAKLLDQTALPAPAGLPEFSGTSSDERTPTRSLRSIHLEDGLQATLPSAEAPPELLLDDYELESKQSPALTRPGAVLGTPLYMAPELWCGEPGTLRSDVYALGALMFELCTGHPPSKAETLKELAILVQQPVPPLASINPNVDPRFASIIDRCLQIQPADRFESAEDVREQLESLITPAPLELGADIALRVPSEHRGLFVERRGEVQAIVDRLESEPAVIVAGEPRAGKSSLCKACVLPALAAKAEPPLTISLQPGRHPAGALISALAPLLQQTESELAEDLATSPTEVARALRLRHPRKILVVFIDQLEELITVADRHEAGQVSAILCELVRAGPAIKLLATAQSELIARLCTLPDWSELLSRSLFFLQPLRSDTFAEASPIELGGPAEAPLASWVEARLSSRRVSAAAWVCAPVALLIAAIALAKSEHDRARAIDERLSDATLLRRRAEVESAAAAELRLLAVRGFDSGDQAEGEAQWSRFLHERQDAEALFAHALATARRGLDLDSSRRALVQEAASILSGWIELRDRSETAELESRLAELDPARAAALHAPARLSIEADPPAARIAIARFTTRDGRLHFEPPVALGPEPLDMQLARAFSNPPREVELAAGGVVIIVAAPGRETMRYPVMLRPGRTFELQAKLLPRHGASTQVSTRACPCVSSACEEMKAAGVSALACALQRSRP